jgi:putative two-component system response regulator
MGKGAIKAPPEREPMQKESANAWCAGVGELAGRLHASQSQLERYAQDFKKLLIKERAERQQLEAANHQLERYAQDLKIAFSAEQARSRELEKVHRDTLLRLLRASRFKDNETAAHLRRIQRLAKLMAEHLRWSLEEVQMIVEASPMHDVGKIAVPDAILHKPGPLSQEEWRIMRRHPTYGALLLQGSHSPLLEMARQIALNHHEHWDGTGYPRGLKGEHIPLSARIIALADVYDALRSRRAYKPALPHSRAAEVILLGDGRTSPEQFDPAVLQAFRELQPRFEVLDDRS